MDRVVARRDERERSEGRRDERGGEKEGGEGGVPSDVQE